jgi:hypothetical protein
LRKSGIKFDDDELPEGQGHMGDGTPGEHFVQRGLDIEVPRPPRHRPADSGMLFSSRGNSRYVEKYALSVCSAFCELID